MDRDDNNPPKPSANNPQDNNQDPFSQLQKALDNSINHLFHTVIALPQAIYEQGNQHGKEWYRTLHKHQVEQENDEAMITSAEEGTTCPYLPHPRDRATAESAQNQGQESCPYLPHPTERVQQKSEISEGDYLRALMDAGEDLFQRAETSAISASDVLRAAMGTEECARHEEGNDWVSSILKELGMTNRRQQDRTRDVCPYFQSDEDPEGEFAGRRSQRQETSEHSDEFRYPNGDRPHPLPFSHIQDTTNHPPRSMLDYTSNVMASQYSPTALEKQQRRNGGDENAKDWQAMYEDLLRIQNAEPLYPSKRDLEEQRQVQSYHDWLVQRVNETRSGVSSAAASSLQGYQSEEAAYNTVAPPIHSSVSSTPSVLSSLTRTETIQNPDGTIIEKRVLRQRFSDGREEVTETTSTSLGKEREESTRRYTSYASDETRKGGVLGELSKGKGDGQTKRGWFWNSSG